MEQTISATKARVHFGELMRRVTEEDQPVIVERGGEPQVVILSVAEYRRLQANQAPRLDWQVLVEQARDQIKAELGQRPLPAITKTLHHIRETRDEQYLAWH